jgi:hypothetical protein
MDRAWPESAQSLDVGSGGITLVTSQAIAWVERIEAHQFAVARLF